MSSPDVKPDRRPRRRRPYNSPERQRGAAQTRARIVTAAHELFLERGYFPTTMRAIAEAAGVAEKTVYLVFTNKPALLDAVIDVAITNAQDQPAPVDDAGETVHAFSQTAAAIMQRTARVLAIAESAATIDPELAESRERGHTAMRTRFETVAATLDASGALDPGVSQAQAAATIYALVNEAVYLRLTDGYGWNAQDYALWLEHVLTITLTITPPAPSRPEASTGH
jgi:AcrR family transcriptional regulator